MKMSMESPQPREISGSQKVASGLGVALGAASVYAIGKWLSNPQLQSRRQLVKDAEASVRKGNQYNPAATYDFPRGLLYLSAGQSYAHAGQAQAAIACLGAACSNIIARIDDSRSAEDRERHLALATVYQTLEHVFSASGQTEEAEITHGLAEARAAEIERLFGISTTFFEDGSRAVHRATPPLSTAA